MIRKLFKHVKFFGPVTTVSVDTDLLGDPLSEKNGVVWRLVSDQQFVSLQKKALPLCEVLRSLAVEQGLAEVAVEDHVVRQRFHPVLWHLICKFFSVTIKMLSRNNSCIRHHHGCCSFRLFSA